jgi:uncharacterized protein YjbI with pentapeptide repeats
MNSNVCNFGLDELKRSLQQRGIPVPLISLGYLPRNWRCGRKVHKNGRCVFHAEDKDPVDFNKALIQELNIMAGQDRYDFTGFIFPKLDFSARTFDKPAYFTGAIFKDEAKFVKATFHEVAKFDGCEFQKVTYFDEATFGGIASFVGSKFKEMVQFKRAKFHKKTEFINSSFKMSDFGGTEFNKEVVFFNTKFLGLTRFTNTLFNETHFKKVVFDGPVWFQFTRFKKDILFLGTKFRRGVSFTDSMFYGDKAYFQATFHKGAYFARTIFRSALFIYTTLHDAAYFVNCVFIGPTLFHNILTTTKGEILKFIGDPSKGIPDLQQFLNGLDTTDKDKFESFWGKDLEQLKTIMRNGKIALKMVSFKETDVVFVKFLNVEWDRKRIGIGPLRMERIVIYDEKLLENSVRRGDYETVAHIYWGLRHNYEKSGRYAEAGDFYISEMEMRRLQNSPPPLRKGSKMTIWERIRWTILSWGWWRRNLLSPLAIYKYLSLYGESYTLAGLWILGTIFLFTFLRTLLPPQGGPSPDILDNPLTRSILALFQLRGEETIDNIERIIGAILTGNLFIALRRRLERR